MRVSLSWLNEYVDVDMAPDDLAHRLNMSGTKVEAIHRPGADIEGVIVAEVLNIEPHPNADNLSMVEVKVHGDETQRVVCGARNFSIGDRVPLARVGSKLPGMAITERKIRGEISRGMLCSGSELGVSKDHSGILVLSPEAPVGADVVALLGLDDTIFELEVTPNRPDCMGMIGVAREVAAVYKKELRIPEAGLEADDVECPVGIEIDDPVGCPRYLARYLEDVKIVPSPSWMATRLLSAGVRPISNIVDATNYVLLETGQPLHAFDATKVADRKIVVRRARAGERLTTLDGIERELDGTDLLIADPSRALALAGIMGGEDSEVTDTTTSIILEAAAFDKASISFSSRRHNLRSEASARFERGSNPDALPYAAARAARFMKETGGGKVSRREPDSYPVVKERPRVTLRPDRTTKLLGYPIPIERQREQLAALKLPAEIVGGVIEVEVPGFRLDLRIEEDLIEEVGRLEGFEGLPSTIPPAHGGSLDARQSTERTLRRVLVGLGVTEAWTSSFLAPADLDALELGSDHPARRLVELMNPMTEYETALRSTLLPGLLRSAARNVAHHAQGVALFEIARVYEPADELANEELVLAAVMTGDRDPASWAGAAKPWDFFAVKGVLEAALATVRVSDLRYAPAHGAPFHPSRGARVAVGDSVIGVLGELHPDVCERFDIPEGSIALEVALAPILASIPERAKAQEISRFPSVFMDLAVIVDEDVAAGDVEDILRTGGAPEVVGVRLFDHYRGEQIPAGKKSLAFALELHDLARTLTDEDAGRVRDRLVVTLAERVGGELRA
ncbi:MAG: phenylalanine--tRNA ligase subunit beta [Actinomycetota bacterium]